MVTSPWTHQSCAISIPDGTAGVDTYASAGCDMCVRISLTKELKLFDDEMWKAVGHKTFCTEMSF